MYGEWQHCTLFCHNHVKRLANLKCDKTTQRRQHNTFFKCDQLPATQLGEINGDAKALRVQSICTNTNGGSIYPESVLQTLVSWLHTVLQISISIKLRKKRATFCLGVICAFIASKLIYSIRRGGRRDILTFVGWDISVHVQYAKVCKNGFVEEGIGEHLYLDRVPPNGNSFASTRRRSQSLQTTYFDRHNLSVGRKMGAKSHASDLEFIIDVADVRFAQPMQIRLPNTSSG